MTEFTASNITNDDLFQFLNTVGDIADRICSLLDSPVDPDDVTFVSCVLAGNFPTEELFRADYDGMPNEEDETLLRSALNELKAILPESFQASESEKGPVNSRRKQPKRKSLDGHFHYADIPDGVIVVSHQETRIRRLLSKGERAFVTDYFVHNMLGDVCACCRQEMAQEDAAKLASSKRPH